MLIQTWVVTLFIVLILGLVAIGFRGWMAADQRIENLTKENQELLKENVKLKSKLSLARLYIDLEEKKR